MHTVRSMLQTIRRSQLTRHFKRLNEKAFSPKHLLVTNLTISLSLSSLGDFLEQQYEMHYTHELQKWDQVRSCRMAISGVTVGLICHHWYQILDKYLPAKTLKNVFKKILLDQFICSPIYISIFFLTLGVLEHKTKEEVWEEIKAKAVRLYAAEWTVWPAAQFINFQFIPLRYRIFYDSTVSLGYDIYTSHVKYARY